MWAARSTGILIAAMAFSTVLALPSAASAQAAQSINAAAPTKRSAVAKAKDLSIHYDVYGDLKSGKTPLLVLHGAFMSADSMRRLALGFSPTRPVIVVDQRGHGRTGDAAGPITYEALADDAAAVLDAAGVKQADVLGYSMGGVAAIRMAISHPTKVAKLVPISAFTRLSGMYPEVVASIAKLTPETFDGSPIRQEYDRLSPRPDRFAVLVDKIKALDRTDFSWDADVRKLPHKTMIVMGDHDGTTPEHTIEMFRMRGGGDVAVALQGFLTKPPQARLLILPATSHIGMMAEAETVVALVTRFLDDETPPMPPEFFGDTAATKQ